MRLATRHKDISNSMALVFKRSFLLFLNLQTLMKNVLLLLARRRDALLNGWPSNNLLAFNVRSRHLILMETDLYHLQKQPLRWQAISLAQIRPRQHNVHTVF